MRRTGFMLAVALVLVLGASWAGADTYSGGLYGNDGGLVGTGRWVTPPTPPGSWTSPGLTWTVTQRSEGYWHYAYQLQVSVGAVSHFALEASEGFGSNDIFGAGGDFNSIQIGWLDPGSDNPGIPDRMYGIKFDEALNTTFNVAFDSWRAAGVGRLLRQGREGTQRRLQRHLELRFHPPGLRSERAAG